MISQKCLECGLDLWEDSEDEIELCNACYDNEALIRFGYFTEAEIRRNI